MTPYFVYDLLIIYLWQLNNTRSPSNHEISAGNFHHNKQSTQDCPFFLAKKNFLAFSATFAQGTLLLLVVGV